MSEHPIPAATIQKVEVEFLELKIPVETQHREVFLRDPKHYFQASIEAAGMKVNGLEISPAQLEALTNAVRSSARSLEVFEPITAHITAPPEKRSKQIIIVMPI